MSWKKLLPLLRVQELLNTPKCESTNRRLLWVKTRTRRFQYWKEIFKEKKQVLAGRRRTRSWTLMKISQRTRRRRKIIYNAKHQAWFTHLPRRITRMKVSDKEKKKLVMSHCYQMVRRNYYETRSMLKISIKTRNPKLEKRPKLLRFQEIKMEPKLRRLLRTPYKQIWNVQVKIQESYEWWCSRRSLMKPKTKKEQEGSTKLKKRKQDGFKTREF